MDQLSAVCRRGVEAQDEMMIEREREREKDENEVSVRERERVKERR